MTALQLLINKWETEMGSYIPNAPIYKTFIEEAKTYLILEKKQIIDAYNQGDCDTFNSTPQFLNSKDYYNKTYNQ